MLRKIGTLFTLLLVTSIGISQESFSLALEGQIFNAPSDSLALIQNNGNNEDQIIGVLELNKKGNFKGSFSLNDPDYYVLQLTDGQKINIIVEGEQTIKVYGNGKNLFFQTNIVGSESSVAMNEFLRYNFSYQKKLDSANRYLQANQDKKREIQQAFRSTYEQFTGERQRFMGQNANSPALIAVLPTFNIQQEFGLYEKAVKGLEQGFGDSPTVKRIVTEYEKNRKQLQATLPVSIGSEAKDIALPNPEGDTLRLSDYRGKVVLLDFWASWCGPCRKENPNVVKLYEKYKEEGFEVFSVSLDRDSTKWVKAIEQDGLVWKGHVSDLQFWKSRAAKKYNVSSIPYTVLIDREGKVIATKLRGAALENQLEALFD